MSRRCKALMAVSALVNGGHMMAPTFLPRTQEQATKSASGS